MFWKIRLVLEAIYDQALFTIGQYSHGLPQLLLDRLGLKLPSRDHILLLVLAKNLKGTAVEVGVFQGYFSAKILTHTLVSKLYSIDPWLEFASQEYVDRANQAQVIQEERYQLTCDRLRPFLERSEIIRATSEQEVASFQDLSLDFVYIDANHSYEQCLLDLQMWWPKVKLGGIIAGDDYTDSDNGVTRYGVKRATNQFFNNQAQRLVITYKSGKIHWPNWYVVKK